MNRLIKRLKVVFNDPNRKGWIRIIREAFDFSLTKKEQPYFYFGKFLYRKEIENYNDYLSSKEVDKITLSKKLHHPAYASILRNKLFFALCTEDNQLPIPALLGYNLGTTFNDRNSTVNIGREELFQFFENIFSTHKCDKIIVKSLTDQGGDNVFLLSYHNLKSKLKEIGGLILKSDTIFQEYVDQHTEISTIYQHSVNTLRLDSYMDKEGVIHIVSAYMRFGAGGSYLDNSSSGGFFVGVDLEEGRLHQKGLQFMKYGGGYISKHPDTGFIFENFKIPYFEESKKLVKKAVSCIPDRLIGWDIAITQYGPVIIEANDNNSLMGPDLVLKGVLKYPIWREILEEA